ncbi:DUF3037 domain-containing protein [Chitinophaga eiseniae]|uniref:DUF3037 domain-containing protein n=1 Tax=Chitinophaga eiseniae TaxID=634771 RepID=A0A847SI63_9BACT|nr:DUF3037 domain-containing protein [Chitinophaga eiseniae]NLR77028.1 DUF3037 domain-containing protein [Chitinophaga eiseniae]
MIKYQYQILRYLPDRVSGEFINVGIVVYDSVKKELLSQFPIKQTRLSNFFQHYDSKLIFDSIKRICNALESIAAIEQHADSLNEITKQILPADESALFFTDVKNGIDISLTSALNHLFKKMIHELDLINKSAGNTDKAVWNNYFKSYFDDYGITSHLKTHKVVTNNDTLEFEKSWKNGKWNLFEPVSFRLSRIDNIKNKVYKWVGKIEELKTSSEPLNLYLLSEIPDDNPELEKFIFDKLGHLHSTKTNVELVTPENVMEYAEKIKNEIQSHHD